MDHAKTRIRINKNVGGDALDRPLQPIEKTKEPVQKDGGAASQIWLHFHFPKEMKTKVSPGPFPARSVHRTLAFRWFKSGAAKKEPRPEGLGSFLELLARFELATSSLPRMRSTG